MRGRTDRQVQMLLDVATEQRVSPHHPIPRARRPVDQALVDRFSSFTQTYKDGGWPSIPPEHLLKGSLLIALSSIRSERWFCERLRYDLLFRLLLDLDIADRPWGASTVSENR
jgi:transposase